MKFRKGPFEPLRPIKMFLLKFADDAKYKAYYDCIPEYKTMILSLCAWKNTLEAVEMQTYFPECLKLKEDGEGEWEKYADKIRGIMSKVSGLEMIDADLKDAYELADIAFPNRKKK